MSKLIAVSEEVYDELSEIKDGKSFTETIKGLLEEKIKKRGTLKEVAKLAGIMDRKDVEKLRKSSKEFRRNFKAREFTSRGLHGSS